MATLSVQLPDEKELTVEEINVSWPLLQAAAFYVGKACERSNNEYMLCRQETKDPRKCVDEAKSVTSCALNFFQALKQHCREDFEQYVNCLERSSGTLDFKHCRRTQAAVDKCILEKFNIERPPFGYFCEAKVHDTKRPPVPSRTDSTVDKYPDRMKNLTAEEWLAGDPERTPKPYTPQK